MPQTDDELIDRIDGLYAYDQGCVSSGIYDPVFKDGLRQNLDETERLMKLYLFYIIRQPLHGFEDAARIVKWAERELGLEY